MPAPVVAAEVAAQQAAQQKLQEEATQPKQGPSKFDSVMTEKTEGARAAQSVEATQRASQTSRVSEMQSIQASQKAESVDLKKIRAIQVQALESSLKTTGTTSSTGPGASTGMMELFGDIERGGGFMDNLMGAATSGKEFSNSELLALQAGMYKYTQELDLTSKVVEKATTGLKDTLKTQV